MTRCNRFSSSFLGLLIFAGLALPVTAQTNVWQGGVSSDWFDPNNWSLGVMPTNEAAVLVPTVATRAPVLTNATAALSGFVLATNQTLTVWGWNSTLTAREMTLSGTVTHATNWLADTNASGTWIPLHRVWLVGSNINVAVKGKIDGSNRGYVTNAGPGRANGVYCSPGHSGTGRRGHSGGVPGPEYGNSAAPVQPGSGGSVNANSGFGGGAVRIEAAGTLTVDGTIAANGQNALSTHGSGGSGGSIWVTCLTLAGATNGLIAAEGGNGNYYGAPAAAGRIAIDYNTNAQAQLAEPCPPIRFSGKPGFRTVTLNAEPLPPPMGTLYFPDTRLVVAAFTGKRFQYVKFVVPGFTNWSPASLTLNDCIFGLPEGFRLAVAGDLLLTNGAALHVFASATADPTNTEGALVDVGGNLLVRSNAWILPYADPTNGAIVKIAVTGNLEVAAFGGLDADYKGYTYCMGPGAPALNAYGGGAYGGFGGQGYEGGQGGRPYGAEAGPIQAGSGCSQQKPTHGGQGGGAIRLVVGNRAVINGTLTALGAPGVATHGPGGAGGGISIECRTFEGSASGLIRVDGGLGSYYGGSGSGGRIVILYNQTAQAALSNPQAPVRFSAYAYPYTTTDYYPNPAEWGTLYFPDTLVLMATPTSAVTWIGQRLWYVRPVIPSFTNWAPASLVMSNCVVRFPDGFRLDVAGDLTLQTGAVIRLHALSSGADGYGAGLTVGGSLSIQTNAWIQPCAHGTNGTVVKIRVAGDAAINAGGGVDADIRGFVPVSGNTAGPGAGRNASGGGGYGGKGGGALGGLTNGLAVMPLTPGSPGGWILRTDGSPAAAGGGAIRLLVNGTLTLNGTLTANGGLGGYYGGAGGSGGGILVAARRLAGSGLMRARGGNIVGNSSSGGGGRIAVWDHLEANSAEYLIAVRSTNRLAALLSHDVFTGSFQVEGGTVATVGDGGTAGFYRYTMSGTMMLIR